jgi:hypothetical protein
VEPYNCREKEVLLWTRRLTRNWHTGVCSNRICVEPNPMTADGTALEHGVVNTAARAIYDDFAVWVQVWISLNSFGRNFGKFFSLLSL